jgi:hypothetical protein
LFFVFLDVYPIDQRANLRQAAKRASANKEEEEQTEESTFLMSTPLSATSGVPSLGGKYSICSF